MPRTECCRTCLILHHDFKSWQAVNYLKIWPLHVGGIRLMCFSDNDKVQEDELG